MDYSTINLPNFYVMGISLKTSNSQAAKDIPIFWNYFFKNNILKKIPNKKSNNVYALYTDYETDYQGPYLFIIGAAVEGINGIPEKMMVKEISKSTYARFNLKGKFPESLMNTWQNIWDLPLKRKYSTDFEVYSEKSQDFKNPDVDIFIALS